MIHSGPSLRSELVAAFIRRLGTADASAPEETVSQMAIALADDALSVFKAEHDALMSGGDD